MVQNWNRLHNRRVNGDNDVPAPVGRARPVVTLQLPDIEGHGMNLHALLAQRERDGRPIRVGLIGAGRFGTMYLAQARNIPGVHVVAIADINTERARGAFRLVDWPADATAGSIADALTTRGTTIVADAAALFDTPEIDIIVEATGNPVVGVNHALRAIETGKHIIMVTVEADALAGPALARRAEKAGVVYSMAYGDQPALIMELVDWARTSGFDVVCAGKGAKYLEHYHEMNPDNVWENWEFSKELTDSGQLNPYMHTSFRDGTKAAIEMAAVANAAGLVPSDDGLTFTPGNVEEIATICRPAAVGGVLANEASVEVMSSVTRDGEWIPFNTQEGVFVVVKATNDYVAGCFGEYPWHPDPTGQYAALYRPYHYVGLELNISIANAVLRGIATGSPRASTATWSPPPRRTSRRARSSTVRAVSRSGASSCRPTTSVRSRLLPVALAHHVELEQRRAQGSAASAGTTSSSTSRSPPRSSCAARPRRSSSSDTLLRNVSSTLHLVPPFQRRKEPPMSSRMRPLRHRGGSDRRAAPAGCLQRHPLRRLAQPSSGSAAGGSSTDMVSLVQADQKTAIDEVTTSRSASRRSSRTPSSATSPGRWPTSSGASSARLRGEAKKLGVDYQTFAVNDESSITEQLDKAQSAMNQGCTAHPGLADLRDRPGQRVPAALAKGVPAIVLNDAKGTVPGVVYVGPDAETIGATAADYIATQLPDGGKVAQIEGDPGSSNALNRGKGFKAGSRSTANLKLVASQTAKWDTSQAQTIATAMLTANPDIKAFYSQNDGMALGVQAAIDAKGLTGKVMLVGTDGIPQAKKEIADGNYTATCQRAADHRGRRGRARSRCGCSPARQVPGWVDVPAFIVDKSNVDQYPTGMP